MALDKTKRYLIKSQQKKGAAHFTVYIWTPELAKRNDMREVSAEDAERVMRGESLPMAALRMPGYVSMQVPESIAHEVSEFIDKKMKDAAAQATEQVPASGGFGFTTIEHGAGNAMVDAMPERADKEPEIADGVREKPFEVVRIEKMQSKNQLEKWAERNMPGLVIDRSKTLDELKAEAIAKLPKNEG